jgi:hypothetical protein
VTVIQAAPQPAVQRNAQGRVDTAVGCVDTGRAQLTIVVCGEVIDLSLSEVLEPEERPIAAENATVEGTAHTWIALDDEHGDALILLLQQAREVRRLAAAQTED